MTHPAMLRGADVECHGPLTDDERHELIHRPFFITYMGTSYPWSGTNIGAGMQSSLQLVPDANGGSRASSRTNKDYDTRTAEGIGAFAPWGEGITLFSSTLHEMQRDTEDSFEEVEG